MCRALQQLGAVRLRIPCAPGAPAEVAESLYIGGLESFNVAAKAAHALAQQYGRLSLRQPTFVPPLVSFQKSHLAVLLHIAGPAYGVSCIPSP